jgi:hypothetical protein
MLLWVWFVLFCKCSLCPSRFKTVGLNFPPVGHSHGPMDQRFSVVMGAVAVAPVMQHPEDKHFSYKLLEPLCLYVCW